MLKSLRQSTKTVMLVVAPVLVGIMVLHCDVDITARRWRTGRENTVGVADGRKVSSAEFRWALQQAYAAQEGDNMKVTSYQFDACTKDRYTDTSTPGEVRLAPSFLLTDEMGVCSKIPEPLTDRLWSSVTFDLPSAKVQAAEVLFYVNRNGETQKSPMTLRVNGHRIEHRQDRERMLTGGWDRTTIPPEYLRDGPNEFVFSGAGVLHVDPLGGGRSARSFDGGKTWHTGVLGPSRDIEGEYLVRLRLRGHPPKGEVASSVVDLADPEEEGAIAPRMRIGKVELSADAEIPVGTGISFEMRTGSTPAFDPATWTPWTQGMELDEPDRFVQWRATLTTESADATPVLRSVTLAAEIEEDASGLENLRIVELERPEIVRSSYAFAYQTPHLKVRWLRDQYRLEEMVAKGRTELEQLALLRDWVRSQWLGWQSDKYPYCPPWDALEILSATKGNWSYGMCTHYAAVFAQCAAALGFVSRMVIIDHHCLAEVWSDELGKWILEDEGAGPAFDDATYERDGALLNALEVHRAVEEDAIGELVANSLPSGRREPIKESIAQIFCRFGISLRNDHLTRPAPAELEHGADQYHFDGYLWWTDDLDPKYPEYSLQTNRPEDLYWTVNRTRIFLQSGEAPGSLRVDLETVTPNFSHYLVQMDDGEWEPRETPFIWSLHPGQNALRVKGINAFGREGGATHAVVYAEE